MKPYVLLRFEALKKVFKKSLKNSLDKRAEARRARQRSPEAAGFN